MIERSEGFASCYSLKKLHDSANPARAWKVLQRAIFVERLLDVLERLQRGPFALCAVVGERANLVSSTVAHRVADTFEINRATGDIN